MLFLPWVRDTSGAEGWRSPIRLAARAPRVGPATSTAGRRRPYARISALVQPASGSNAADRNHSRTTVKEQSERSGSLPRRFEVVRGGADYQRCAEEGAAYERRARRLRELEPTAREKRKRRVNRSDVVVQRGPSRSRPHVVFRCPRSRSWSRGLGIRSTVAPSKRELRAAGVPSVPGGQARFGSTSGNGVVLLLCTSHRLPLSTTDDGHTWATVRLMRASRPSGCTSPAASASVGCSSHRRRKPGSDRRRRCSSVACRSSAVAGAEGASLGPPAIPHREPSRYRRAVPRGNLPAAKFPSEPSQCSARGTARVRREGTSGLACCVLGCARGRS